MQYLLTQSQQHTPLILSDKRLSRSKEDNEIYIQNLSSNYQKGISPSVREWIRKLWYIYTMEYCSEIQRNEQYNNHKITMLNEESQIKKSRCRMIPFL